MLVVMSDRIEAEQLLEEINELVVEDCVGFFPGGEEDPESPIIVNPRRVGLQMCFLQNLLLDRLRIAIVSSEGIAQKLPCKEDLQKDCFDISVGGTYDLYVLVDQLVHFGYSREVVVEKPGEISLRGGILDIFPYTGEEPHRLEFDGNRIESIRIFDITTQRSKKQVQSLLIISSPTAWGKCNASLFSFFPDNLLLFLQDPDLIMAGVEKEIMKKRKCMLSFDELTNHFNRFQTVSYLTLSSIGEPVDLGGRVPGRLGKTIAEIRENLASLCDTRKTVFLFCAGEERRKRIEELLDLIADPIARFHVDPGSLSRGFDLPSIGLTVLSDCDLFGTPPRQRRRERFKMGVPIRELSALRVGDFVVHIDHGIGKYQGLKKISVREVERECLVIQYEGEDNLYVPVDQMERVQKYAPKEGFQPSLSKLGSGRWEKIKTRTKLSIKTIAKELIALYSARQVLPGFSFSADTVWQKELETAFLYEETPDQTRTVQEVKADMEQSRPMDRLICGDVGYGKTEVAVRASFKAVHDGKQVALLVPTTILAQQHYRTFQERLSLFPVNIDMLSRFRNRGEQKKIIEQIKRGAVDIVIGTHRLLSNDVRFKDLGLLIIDEEQRFGVRHKEKLKSLRRTVDVLALSATPIPRTLHLSMMGIRDMSLIGTPPKDRLPIITEVAPFDEKIIVEAVEREIARGGQVFFVHNRIRSIYAVARMIRRLVPGVRLAVVHGKMEEKRLEKVMIEFGEGQYDCLVATMIVESGLDIPNVNTLVVHRADRLGLAQLYQLRGRVGRSDKRAYAYLLTPPFHQLNSEAIKRLRTIEEFTELGSGIQIALRDLEIRGSGNILGMQQSGNINAVGFELYMKLVEEAIQELKESKEKRIGGDSSETECQVVADFPAYLPESYVADAGLRVQVYRQLSLSQTDSEIDILKDELRDRFGFIPKETINLLDIAFIRLLGQKNNVKKIVLREGLLKIYFHKKWVECFDGSEHISQKLRTMIDSAPVPIRFLGGRQFGLCGSVSLDEALAVTKKMLQSWN
ncbi:transcription-repair coupling factor [bacterium]|nr:transcription-repair coupling factor [bacterium]